MTDTQITQDMLHAYVDGQLDPSDMAQVETYLADNPDMLDELADWAEQNNDIRALYPAPDHAIQLPETPAAQVAANSPRAPFGAIAASVAMLAIGAGLGWYTRGNTQQDTEILVAGLVSEAVNAHAVYSVDPHRAVEVKASEEALLVSWLSNRVGQQLTAPDLTANGFELVGGRLLAVSEGPAAQFMYENAAGTRITLFAARGNGTQMAEFSYEQKGDTGTFTWADENLRYAIIGDIPREDLNALAIRVYEAFS